MADDSSSDDGSAQAHKVILLGDGTVGKTSLAMRFANDSFGKQYKQTLGLDFFRRSVAVSADVTANLSIWDIGGQSLGGKMVGNYIFGAQAVLLCYDITNAQTFANLEDWYKLVKKTFEGQDKKPLLYLVGNKIDLNHLRAVKLERHQAWAKENGFRGSFFVSAKSGDQCGGLLLQVASDLSGHAVKKAEIVAASKVVKAEIVNHPNDAGDQKSKAKGDKKKCIVS